MLNTYTVPFEKVCTFNAKRHKEIQDEKLFVPVGLDTRSLLAKNKKKHTDKYNYLLHYLHISRVLNQKYENDEYIPVNQEVLSEYVTKRRAKSIIDFWLNLNVIECDDKAKKGVKSLGYRLTDDYKNEPVVDVGVVDEVFENRLRLLRQRNDQKFDLRVPQHRFLHYCLHEVRVAATEAKHWLTEQASKNYRLTPSNATTKEKKDIEAHNNRINSKLFRNCTAITLIADEALRIKRDSTGRRVHHNIATLNRGSRNFICLKNGSVLWNCDVRNSQPLIMCLLLKREYEGKQMPKCTLKYIDYCERGILYDELMKELGLPAGTDRVAFKKRVFKAVYYGENKHAAYYPEWRAFSSMFATVAQFITAYKRKNYKQLSIDMQRAESEIIIDGVIARLAAKHMPQDFFALTIHDSILCEEHNVTEIVDIMEDEFKKRGLTPTIEKKKLGLPHINF